MTRAIVLACLVCGACATVQEYVDAEQVLYAGTSNGRLEKFTTSGVYLGGFPIPQPWSIAAGASGDVFVTPLAGPNTIYHFDSSGNFEGIATATVDLSDPSGVIFTLGLDIDQSGRPYVGVNATKDRVERFDPSGTSLGIFAQTSNSGAPLDLSFGRDGTLFVTADFNKILHYSADGQLLGSVTTTHGSPMRFALDSQNNIYTIGFGGATPNQYVDIYSSAGAYLHSISIGITEATFSIAIDEDDIVYVGGDATIRRWRTDGTSLGTLVLTPPNPIQFHGYNDLDFVSVVPEPSILLLAAMAGIWIGATFAHRSDRSRRMSQ
jgi:hypothetical protein